ncbi:NACHT domain-containing protein [Aeromonas salmonicida]|uniref:NACHT domain-containing protein n=1 Tax=Aeromonas salmonicida TaxID=645 RepID=UPI0035A2FA65
MKSTEGKFHVDEISDIYNHYGFETISQDSNHISLINNNGFSPYIETIYINDSNLKNLSEEIGAIENRIRFTKITDLKFHLFSLVFKKDQAARRISLEYSDFIKTITNGIYDSASYQYINGEYLVDGERSSNKNIIQEIKNEITSNDNPSLVIIEAAAGFGKTCTAFELMKQLNEDDCFRGIPLLAELTRNKTARIFKYVLLDEINRCFNNLKLDLAINEIKNGNICVIIDGFDELIHKESQKNSKKRFENAESMLETISELLTDNAKIVITTRRTAIFDGEEFQDWIDTKQEKFSVKRYRIMEPLITDWIGKKRQDELVSCGVDIRKLSNPVLLSYLRAMDDIVFSEHLKNPEKIVPNYIERMLSREKTRQTIEIEPHEQNQILISIACDMLLNDYTKEDKDYISALISEKNYDILMSHINSSKAPVKVDMDSIIKTIRGHAFLDKKGHSGSQIGFVNDFILGYYAGKAIEQYTDELNEFLVSGIFVESIFNANSVNTKDTKDFMWEKLFLSFDCLNGSDKLSFSQIIKDEIDFEIHDSDINGIIFEDLEMFIKSKASVVTFNGCIFSRITLSKNNLNDVSFINCSFYECLITDPDIFNDTIYCIGCDSENSDFIKLLSAPIIEAEVEIEVELARCNECRIAILEKFWPNGKDKAFKHRPISIIHGLSKQFGLRILSESMRSLFDEGVLEKAQKNSHIQLSNKFEEIQLILGRK